MIIIQEDIENRSFALSFKAARVTEQVLAKAMMAMLRKMKEARDAPKEGKQTIMELSKGGANLSSIEVADGNIKAFDPIARKYGISYALHKDPSTEPPKWLVFFRAKDVDVMTAAFKEFSAKVMGREKDKPSVREEVSKHKDKTKERTAKAPARGEKSKDKVRVKVKNKHKGGPEL